MRFSILPSLLAADMACFGDEIRRAEAAGADALHLDIMDGHFVPNISFGPEAVAMARRVCAGLPLNVHLMLSRPAAYLPVFAEAGADRILVHVEAEDSPGELLAELARLGVSAGLTLNPATPAEAVFPYIGQIDQVLCMSVNPGYGGQAFMPEVMPKLARIRSEADRLGYRELSLMVDGGINEETACACAVAGADAFVAGTYLFKAPDMGQRLHALRVALDAAVRQTGR